ncbi:aminotransferase class V-fold PLP-dependent enzyme, partial [Streptomyces albidoflavus]|uniref:aminotransferase class V-fold PLP-dependent enzyme n=1 Tax=Streptomyces albidoflavus TaxID=1886 RepID=UPI0011873FC9
VHLDLAAAERALVADPALTHVGVVHQETSSGMLNEVAAVARISHGFGCQDIVDAVSTIGAERLSLAGDGLDWLAARARKIREVMRASPREGLCVPAGRLPPGGP